MLLISQIFNYEISYKDIFDCIIQNIRSTNDKNIKTLCILGLQNMFICDLKNSYSKFYNLLIFLYTFNNEKKYYDINWIESLLHIISKTNKNVNSLSDFEKVCKKILKNKNSFLHYKLYISMNSFNNDYILSFYKKIQNDTLQMKYIHYFIDIVNETKCKLFNFENLKKIDSLD